MAAPDEVEILRRHFGTSSWETLSSALYLFAEQGEFTQAHAHTNDEPFVMPLRAVNILNFAVSCRVNNG